MKHNVWFPFALAWAALLLPSLTARANNSIHTTFLWHLHQPIYWPDRKTNGPDHYENAWDTIQQQNAGRPHPNPESLNTIFSVADRVNAYQVSPHDAVSSILGYPNAGAQVNYSGALMENVQSLATAGQYGYGSTWYQPNRDARGWTTSAGKPRMDLVNFTYHHALAPLVSAETLEMELRIHQRQMEVFWGTNVPDSHGYFPAETCFAPYMIPTLKKLGIQWSVIANNHLARACADFPVVTGSGGENCDLPNKADQLNPAQGAENYQRISIDRGCAPTQVMPFGFQTHYVHYVDPQSGSNSTLIAIPSDQALGWKDSYSTWDLGLLAPLAARNNPAKPSLALFAHDGDNAWSGGYSYYYQWINQLASEASGLGYEPTTVEQFLSEFPPDTNDVVHVETGGWVFADGDFGSPMFINWHWPPSYTDGSGNNVVDPSQGVSDKADNWRVIIATENRVKTAQQISGISPRTDQIRDPGSFSATPNSVELGWHYYLASLDSGFVYYGCTGDECQRATVAQANVAREVDGILTGNPAADTTGPTMFIPQRHPWNPGGTNYGVQYKYKTTVPTNIDFWIWTYAYDVSGITNVTLYYRVNGVIPPSSDEFQTYAGGPDTGAWIPSNMTLRNVTPVTGVNPLYIAQYYYAKITGVTNSFVDYYVSATDSRGNNTKSPIQHVWVDAGTGSSGGGGTTNGCNGRVCVYPTPLVAGTSATIQYSPAGGPIASATSVNIHLGWNGWNPVVSPDAAMTLVSNVWQYTVNIPLSATQLNCVFNNGNNTWDNNNSANWNFSIVTNSTPQVPPQPAGLTANPISTNQINLAWAASFGANGYIVNRGGSPITTVAGTNYSDTGLSANTAYCYTIVATNSIGNSSPSTSVCATTAATNTPVTYPPFIMDGAVDSTNYLLASNGMTLYAALRGSNLYVATWSTGNGGGSNDHFIFVSDQLLPSATAIAPWAKAGHVAVATNKPFLAAESVNSYIAWYNAPTNSVAFKSSSSSGQMEGTIDLVAAFGSVPTNIYLAAAAYQTSDGGSLASEAPGATAPDIGTNGFFVIPTVALHDFDGNGIFDRLEPNLDFLLLNATQTNGGGFTLNWNSMPGHSYQVVYRDIVTNSWANLPGASNTAGPLQTVLSYTDPWPTNTAQRFYKIKLTH
jgi:hypothetical protein